MTQQSWRDIFLGDISTIDSPVVLRRWAYAWADEIKTKCPDYVDDVRAEYLERLAELQKACKE